MLQAEFEPATYSATLQSCNPSFGYGLQAMELRYTRLPSSTNYGLFGAPCTVDDLRTTVDDLRTTATHHRGSPFTFTPASSICLLRRKRAVLRALSLQPLVLRMRTTVYGVTLRWNAVVDGLRFLTSTITTTITTTTPFAVPPGTDPTQHLGF